MKLTADFETTTDPNDCRVWAWGVCEVGNTDYFQYGNTLDEFMEYLQSVSGSTVWFHNERFDGEFILVWLFEHGFRHVRNRFEEETKTFSTLISEQGQFYSIKIVFEKKGKKTKYVRILDSLKVIPFSIDEIAKAFNLPNRKLHIDYTEYREVGHILTSDEVAYLYNDVAIAAGALNVLFEQGLNRLTQASNALFNYKETVGKDNFEHWFPKLLPIQDRDIRKAYKGGYTYPNPVYQRLVNGRTLVLDINSLYPWVLRYCKLPYGRPIYFNGKYKPDAQYDLYVQQFTCRFKLKEGKLPMIQIKNSFRFSRTEYLTQSEQPYDDRPVVLTLTNVDLALFYENYEVWDEEWDSGWKFKSTTGLFSDYIDYWMGVKEEASRNKNKAMRTLAKFMLNALYGKFGTALTGKSKFPVYDDGKISYETGPEELRKALYVPVATFVTAWARDKTIRSALKVIDKFIYSDTDSLHLSIDLPDEIMLMSEDELEEMSTAQLRAYGVDIPADFDIDPVRLGAWKIESVFHRNKTIRAKTYVEDGNRPEVWGRQRFSSKAHKEFCEDTGVKDDMSKYSWMYDIDKLNVVCAGMPKACHPYVTFDNFEENRSYPGKLKPKHVVGGIVLVPEPYTIQAN